MHDIIPQHYGILGTLYLVNKYQSGFLTIYTYLDLITKKTSTKIIIKGV